MSIKTKIAIIGSTGSVGKNTLDVISKYSKNFSIELLVSNKNKNLILKQIKKFSPKNVYIYDDKIRIQLKKKLLKKTNFLDSFEDLKNMYLSKKKKLDISILAISSLEGLRYAFEFIKFSKKILVANKESLICGGKILLNKALFYGCKIRSIDSEHYCIFETLKFSNNKKIDSIYLTASGGPFLGKSKNIYAKSTVADVIRHPTWKMGKKISVDSATMINKVLEIIEAHLLFKIPFNKIRIKVHKQSLVHSAVVFKNGLVKMIMHDTTMKIPISNSLFENKNISVDKNYFKESKFFNLTFDENAINKFDIFKIANKIFKLGPTAWILLNVFNEFLVNKFLNNEIFFYEIEQKLIKLFHSKNILIFCKKKIKNYSDINNVINFGESYIKKNETFI